jgi:uncharacterized RDD family membrane protein YckC
MTTPTPGWYPDPQVPRQMRWWDGSAWTSDVYERVEPPGGYLSETAPAQQSGTQQHPAGQAVTTDDGTPLAAWGKRLSARVIDGLIIGPLTLLLSLPLVTDLVRHLADVLQDQGGRFDPFGAYDAETLRLAASISLVSLLISLVYEMAFLLWKAATPGKLLLGLRVRRWAPGERLGATIVARRWIGSTGIGQLLGAPYVVVDGLWPLWDKRRQALHDKFAGTCVVDARAAEQRSGAR